jgi:hypothetical protein
MPITQVMLFPTAHSKAAITSLQESELILSPTNLLFKRRKKSRGRPKKFGEKVVLHQLFNDTSSFTSALSTAYNEKPLLSTQSRTAPSLTATINGFKSRTLSFVKTRSIF